MAAFLKRCSTHAPPAAASSVFYVHTSINKNILWTFIDVVSCTGCAAITLSLLASFRLYLRSIFFLGAESSLKLLTRIDVPVDEVTFSVDEETGKSVVIGREN